jgi:hypothetical protein
MNKSVITAVLLTLVPALTMAAQLYRWVDDKGNVEWRDTPPPATAKKVERRKIHDNTIDTAEVPYSVQQATKNFPVTLWITNCGEMCDKARAYLSHRGVPYTEKNPEADVAAFKKASGGGLEVPLLLVGNRKMTGYLESEWDAALDFAGYPKTAPVLPRPAAQPLATAGTKPAPATTTPTPTAVAPAPGTVPPAVGAAPGSTVAPAAPAGTAPANGNPVSAR